MLTNRGNACLFRFPLFAASLIFLFVSSCARLLERKVGDGGLISGDPCSAPCFWGIIPGVTSRSQTIEILRQENIVSFCEISNDINCYHNIYITFGIDGIVESAGFNLFDDVTVQSVIDIYGEPNYVDVFYDPSTQESRGFCQMTLLYDSINALITLEYYPDSFYQLRKNSHVNEVSYLDDQAYQEYVDWSSHLLEWQGFTTYFDPDPMGP